MSIRDTADELNISPHTLKNWLRRENQGLDEFQIPQEKRLLTRRANKKHSKNQFIPLELVLYKKNLQTLSELTEKLRLPELDIPQTLFIFILLLLKQKGHLHPSRQDSWNTAVSWLVDCESPPVLRKALESFQALLPPFPENWNIPEDLLSEDLFSPMLLKEPDLPGLIYQALRQEGNKILHGAYFTPRNIIKEMLRPYRSGAKNIRFLDPCCGSGMFLCSYAEMTGIPENAGGMDKDPAAVFLARINLFLRFPRIASLDHIRIADALLPESWDLHGDAIIATNPPWGAHYSHQEKRELIRRYAPIRSGESFAFFIARSIEELPEGGRASFLLPESLLYVKTHKNIRELLLKEASPTKITHFGRLFHGVYTPVIQMEIQKGSRIRKPGILIKNSRGLLLLSEKQPLKRYRENRNSIINIHCSNGDALLVRSVFEGPSNQLGKGCKWILGTVTGDNKRFLTSEADDRTIPVLTGKEVSPFYTTPPRLFMRTDVGAWQQSRSQEEYKPEKIIYTFIGIKPSFAIDRTGVGTLNSANCLIPGGEHTPEELTAWFNSSLFRFLWRKQYHSLKLLRNHLETLPVPDWDESQKEHLAHLVKKAENRQDIKLEIDQMIFDLYEFSLKDRKYVSSEQWL